MTTLTLTTLTLAEAAPYCIAPDGWVRPNPRRITPLREGDAFFLTDPQPDASSAVERFVRSRLAALLPGQVAHPDALNVIRVSTRHYFREYARPDIILPLAASKIAVEVDGRFAPNGVQGHTGIRRTRDVEKSTALVAAGFHVIRLRLHRLPPLTHPDGQPIPGVTNIVTKSGRAQARDLEAIIQTIAQIQTQRNRLARPALAA